MRIRFLLGPAGSGKTHRCLAEIRAALQESAEGAPLVLLAPKQATFQLERQLLADSALVGYTRLRILSFERLAEFIFEQLGRPLPRLLAEEGRVMVLRALLEQQRGELELFHGSARLPGFARQLSQVLRELQQHQLGPARLEDLAARAQDGHRLPAKLRDLARILRAYYNWLKAQALQDADQGLDHATVALKQNSEAGSGEPNGLNTQYPRLKIDSLWLDGFAQMTPQERQLLTAVIPCADSATLAFCLESEPEQLPPWHSTWAPVTETFLRCRDDLRLLADANVTVETLSHEPGRNRFHAAPVLQHLAKHWSRPAAFENTDVQPTLSPALRLVASANPESEVEFVAHEIRRYVREQHGRFRDVAVLSRSLDGYHDAIRRVFTRYEIPFFLDRRESVAHHPLAELTRFALRLAAFNWETEDWFGVLKTGLADDDENAIDRLENEALARGWRGRQFWSEPITSPALSETARQPIERLRSRVFPPFQRLVDALATHDRRVNGKQLATALRALWSGLEVNRKLERWSVAAGQNPSLPNPALHETVWKQMAEWLDNVELAFATESLRLNEWLPVIEAGLGNLSVGVIPPALDQVLVGTIDRSRNPDLQLAFVIGVNEGVFPAPPAAPVLLNRVEREMLASDNATLGPGHRQQIGLERYYGYIACTRARQSTVLTWSRTSGSGRELNPSIFINDLQRLFPELPIEEFAGFQDPASAEHWSEVIAPLMKNLPATPHSPLAKAVPQIQEILLKHIALDGAKLPTDLPTELVEQLYGMELRTSVSGLEDFAACPFRFFVIRGLRAEERVEFEIDPREKGSFQHEVLKEFHARLKNNHQRWRDVSPDQARLLVRQIGGELLPTFRDGLFTAAAARRFTGEMLIEGLEKLVETLILWSSQYGFDPAAVEISFGLPDSRLPAWRIDLDERHALLLRGRIDRVDICRVETTGETLAVVIDYKSSPRELDPVKVHHGLELQLLAYLGALSQLDGFLSDSDVSRLIPAGAFYVALKSGGGSASTRNDEQDGREQARRSGSQHRGRFDAGHLTKFDAGGGNKGEQFRFTIKKDGTLSSRGNEALASDEFHALVARVKQFLQQHGRDIYAGKIGVTPFRWKQATACDYCDYRPVCRFDPWTQPYRALRPPAQ